MSAEFVVFAVLAGALVLFILDRWRYDIVALTALLFLAVPGIVPANEAFSGFGHPAVITVAAVLVVSRGLADSGVVDRMADVLDRLGSSPIALIGGLTVTVTFCSAFMNNVGALALLLPVALRLGQKHEVSSSVLLMPLAFGSLLGGMTTLIGTPPNIIIGAFRREAMGEPYGLFAFSPVGVGVAVVGVAFLTFIGWRFLPLRQGQGSAQDVFAIQDYTTELVVPAGSPYVGRSLRSLAQAAGAEIVIAAVVRGKRKTFAPTGYFELRAGDSLVVEIDPEDLEGALEATGLRLEADPKVVDEDSFDEAALHFFEAVVLPRSRIVGQSAETLQLRASQGLNLLAVARQGARIHKRLKAITFEPGDILLLQSEAPPDRETLTHLGLLPLAPRKLQVRRRRQRMALALGIFGATVASLVFQLLPAQIAFSVAALVMVLTGLVSLRDAYRAIDWPILVLLGAMIPVGEALEATGGAARLAATLGTLADTLPSWAMVALVLALAMVLSDVMNNAATAVLLAPVAIGVAHGMDASPDPFLMAVAVGASCAFLTPIGHQSNTLVMGPGGYRFGDYWRLGLPLEILIVLLGTPLILWAWPL